MMDQKIISFDSQLLNSFQSCARKFKLSHIDNIELPEKAEALETGDLMHKLLEPYYALQIREVFDKLRAGIAISELWNEILSAGIEVPDLNWHDFPGRQGFAVKIGRFFATKMDLPIEEIEETIRHFIDYTNYYRNDSWNPLAVEEVGSKILYEDYELKIVYNFKIDLIAEQGKIIAPFDHKTARRRSEPSSLSNQFIGYCFGLGLNNIVINKIGFQKTLSPQQRFNRFILTIDDARIEEWKSNTLFWARAMIRAQEEKSFPMNLTSCDKYSGCIFSRICETDPESREFKIERDYKRRGQWDVAKVLEDK